MRCQSGTRIWGGTKRAMEENSTLGGIPRLRHLLRFSATAPRIPGDDATQDATLKLSVEGAHPPSGPRQRRRRIPRWAIVVVTLVVLVALVVPSALAV